LLEIQETNTKIKRQTQTSQAGSYFKFFKQNIILPHASSLKLDTEKEFDRNRMAVIKYDITL